MSNVVHDAGVTDGTAVWGTFSGDTASNGGVVALVESLFAIYPGADLVPENPVNQAEVFETLRAKLLDFKAAGGAAIVDLGGLTLGRDTELLLLLEETTGVEIVISTGFGAPWTIGSHFTNNVSDVGMTVPRIADIMYRELSEGLLVPPRERLPRRAGVISVASSSRADPSLPLTRGRDIIETDVIRAAATVAAELHAPLVLKVTETPQAALDILDQEHVDPAHVLIRGLDRTEHLAGDLPKQLAKRGYLVGFDHFGWRSDAGSADDDARIRAVLELCDAGFGEQIIVSSNAVGYTVGVAGRAELPTPVTDFTSVLTGFAPAFRAAGGSEEQLALLLAANPRRFLASSVNSPDVTTSVISGETATVAASTSFRTATVRVPAPQPASTLSTRNDGTSQAPQAAHDMGVVNTVLGPIPTEQLGITAVHEHINFGQNGWYLESDFWHPASHIIALAEHHLGEFRRLGGRTYVDLTGIGNFRDVSLYRVIAKSTRINFVACTGFWTGMGTRPWFWDKPVGYLRDLFIKEITDGIDDTGAKAGVIKVGVSFGGLSDMDRKIYTAAGQAAVATGVPILTHLSTDAMTQLDILEAQGLDPARVVIGHADAGVDIDHQRDVAVARRGAFVGIDNVGYETEKEPRVPWAQPRRERLRQILELLEAGYADHVAVSADADVQALGWVSPPHSVADLLGQFVPDLVAEGVDETTVHQLLVDNPARLLTMQDGRGSQRTRENRETPDTPDTIKEAENG